MEDIRKKIIIIKDEPVVMDIKVIVCGECNNVLCELASEKENTERAKEIYDRPIVTISMSNMGLATRLLGEQFGSAITFGKADNGSAPGQIDVDSLKQVLKIIHENI